MRVDELLGEARKTWGDDKLTLEEIAIRMGVVLGDINRLTRDLQESGVVDELALKKELGNTIYSMIRWCDDLGFDPKECISMAIQAQLAYVQKHRK